MPHGGAIGQVSRSRDFWLPNKPAYALMAHAEEQGDLEDSQVPVLGHGVAWIPPPPDHETRPSSDRLRGGSGTPGGAVGMLRETDG